MTLFSITNHSPCPDCGGARVGLDYDDTFVVAPGVVAEHPECSAEEEVFRWKEYHAGCTLEEERRLRGRSCAAARAAAEEAASRPCPDCGGARDVLEPRRWTHYRFSVACRNTRPDRHVGRRYVEPRPGCDTCRTVSQA